MTGFIAGAPAAQVCGTDNAPIEAARPRPADTAPPLPPLPRPGKPADPNTPAPEPNPPARADPAASAPLAAALVVDIRDFDVFAIDQPLCASDDTVDTGDMTVFRFFSASSGDVDDIDDVEDSGEASPCSVAGTADIACDSTICVFAAAEVPVAWATAAPWAANPPGLVACCGGVNGVNVEAAAEAPA
ncbi:MAG: hypothetical protein ACREOE_12255 [Gemmatimonadales bacterium]